MKKFWSEYSYNIVKMFINQIAIAVFGLILWYTTTLAEADAMVKWSSAFSIIFYLFLIYTITWEVGFKDRARHKGGRKAYVPLRGLYMSLLANSINLLLALIIAAGWVLASPEVGLGIGWADGMQAFAGLIAKFLQGMYMGFINKTDVITPVPVYFLITLPSMAVAAVSYILGCKDAKIGSLFGLIKPDDKR